MMMWRVLIGQVVSARIVTGGNIWLDRFESEDCHMTTYE